MIEYIRTGTKYLRVWRIIRKAEKSYTDIETAKARLMELQKYKVSDWEGVRMMEEINCAVKSLDDCIHHLSRYRPKGLADIPDMIHEAHKYDEEKKKREELKKLIR